MLQDVSHNDLSTFTSFIQYKNTKRRGEILLNERGNDFEQKWFRLSIGNKIISSCNKLQQVYFYAKEKLQHRKQELCVDDKIESHGSHSIHCFSNFDQQSSLINVIICIISHLWEEQL